MSADINRLPVDPGLSGWLAVSTNRKLFLQLAQDQSVDWLVIGAGFAGLSAARRLAQLRQGERIVVLDAKGIAEGPAGRNSGFMIDLPHSLATGKPSSTTFEQSRREIVENRHAIAFAADAAAEYRMSPGTFDHCGKINAAATARGERFNALFAGSLDRLGEPYERLDATSMRELTGSSYFVSGLRTPNAVIIQPASYIHSLADGLRPVAEIYENSPVRSLRRENGSWIAETPGGRIIAPKVILAVNGHAADFGHFKGRLMHVFTYASMTAPLTHAAKASISTGAREWGLLPADTMGTTLRKISTAQGERFVIRTHYTYEPNFAVTETDVANISYSQRKSFDARFPQLGGLPFEYRWAGRLCLTSNHVPAFGEVDEGLFSACVCNGLGTVKSTLSGVLAAEAATGTNSSLLESYRAQPAPRRLPPPPFAYLGINAVIRWQQYRAGPEG